MDISFTFCKPNKIKTCFNLKQVGEHEDSFMRATIIDGCVSYEMSFCTYCWTNILSLIFNRYDGRKLLINSILKTIENGGGNYVKHIIKQNKKPLADAKAYRKAREDFELAYTDGS